MSKKRIAGIVIGGTLAAALAAGGIGVVAYALTPVTHPYVNVAQSHEISAGAIEDTQLAASTSRTSAEWTAAQELAAKKAAEAAAALAAQQAAQAAAAQQAALEAAVQQQAAQDDSGSYSADSGSSASEPSAPALIKCPAGSQANSGDGGNDTSCFPVICFHITLPDPAHPECATPFKP